MSAGTSLAPLEKNARFSAGIFSITGGTEGFEPSPKPQHLSHFLNSGLAFYPYFYPQMCRLSGLQVGSSTTSNEHTTPTTTQIENLNDPEVVVGRVANPS